MRSKSRCTGFQTAVTLAEYEHQGGPDSKITIEQSHLEQVMKMSQAFDKYLKVTRKGLSDSDIAKAFDLRADDFDEEMVGKVVAKSMSEVAKQKLQERAGKKLAN